MRLKVFSGLARTLGSALVFSLALIVSAEGGNSSPQVLALVSNDQPMEFNCFSGECFVELSAFCLQPDYKSPDARTKYELAGAGGIKVTGYTKDGTPLSLDPKKHFKLEALRTHVAVRMTMTTNELHRRGLSRITVTVDHNVSLVPAASEQFIAQAPVEIEMAVGPWREIGAQVIDRNKLEMDAARVTNHIANGLPPFTHVGQKTTKAAWAKVEKNGMLARLEPGAARLLKASFDSCVESTGYGGLLTLRGCVSNMHDRFLGDLNIKYWDILKGAS